MRSNATPTTAGPAQARLWATGLGRIVRRPRGAAPAVAVLTLAVLALLPSDAAATTPQTLWTRCLADTESDVQCSNPRGVATAPSSAGAGVAGNVFVAEQRARRVVEFTPWGQFVRTFGWGVVASGPDDKPRNEIQQLTVDATAGTFELHVPNTDKTTAAIPFDASAAAVQAALEELPPLEFSGIVDGPGAFAVSGPTGGPWAIEFTAAIADTDIPLFEVVNSTLTGATATATLTTTQGGASFEVCVPADGDICRIGQEGTAPGQFAFTSPQGVAVDSAGDVYVLDAGQPSNQRVQKFDPEGHFLRMWGKGVNTGTSGNAEICTNAGPPTDVCGPGDEGTGPGQFGKLAPVGNYIAIDTLGTPSAADDRVYVGDESRIQRFDSAGVYQSQIALPGETVKALAADPSGNLYASFCGLSCLGAAKANVRKLSSAGLELGTIAVADPQALAAGPAGELFVVDGASNPTIRQFSPAGAEVPAFAFQDGFSSSTGIATGSACLSASSDLYVSNLQLAPNSFIRAYGPAPDEAHIALCPPPPHAPEIEGQGTLSVETELAVVQAQINPKFWPDTSYYVQYATAACIEATGWEAPCVTATPEAQLGAGAIEAGAKTAKIPFAGLTPATEYLYRFVSESGGGGPVYGKGGTAGQEGEANLFTTPAVFGPPPPDTCPNQALRSDSSAALPDCRAYEMVSPLDKNGGDVQRAGGDVQASPDGNRITYAAPSTFGDQPSSKFINQYLAARQEGLGWSDHGINAPLGRQLEPPGEGIVYAFREVSAFSSDLCNEWLADYNTTPLAPDAQQGYVNLYRRDLCGASGFEALSTATPPPGISRLNYLDQYSVQGFSADSGHVLITARAGLTPEAVPGKTNAQIYDYSRSSGELHLVSVLPGGSADPGILTAGAEVGGGVGFEGGGNLHHAVSDDGSRVFWTSAVVHGSAKGKLYLREHPEQGIVADECNETAKACTVAVSSGEAAFWDASPSGSEALYSEGKLQNEAGEGEATLYRFDVESKTRSVLVQGFSGLLGASEDLSRIYYVSTEALTPGQKNSAGAEAQAGEPNLYLDEGGTRIFVATLLSGAGGDVAGQTGLRQVYSIASYDPHYNAARVSADGAHIVFESRAPLTHYDNTDLNSGEPDVEVFTYEAGGALRCVSCNPTGVRPSGHELGRSYVSHDSLETGVWGAAWIPAFEHPLHASNPLSSDGGRLFFNSYDPLLRRDTNGVQDVYEWEAPGIGGCSKESQAYRKANGGCVYLISIGESPFESEFWEASADGRDVFFTTESSLLSQDPGNVDLYDARVGGGFAQPTPPAACEGEACQSPPPTPNVPTPASASFEGPGSPKQVGGAKPRCAKGKRVVRRGGKARCVPKRVHKRNANHSRRAAR